MKRSNSYRLLLAAVLAIGFLQTSLATVIQTPAGLLPGDKFRIAFITAGTTTAQSTVIGDYDAFVNAQADGATYNGQPVSFLAIASTHTVHAIDHIGQNAAPVYLNDGVSKVASNTTDNIVTGGLWSGHSLNHAITKDIAGATWNQIRVWTGTDLFGVDWGGSRGLGSFQPEVGFNFFNSSAWVEAGFDIYSNLHPMYGISSVLTVPVPEPESVVLLGLGAISLIAVARRKRA